MTLKRVNASGTCFFLFLVVLLFINISFASFAQEAPSVRPDLWQQAQMAVENNDLTDALRLLRICSFSGEKIDEAQQLLKSILASQAAELELKIDSAKSPSLMTVFNIREEICSLRVADSADWKAYLIAADRFSEIDRLLVAGQRFLNRYREGFKVEFDSKWIDLLKKLSANFKEEWQIIYRWQVNRILASLPATAQDYKVEFENTDILAQTRAKAVLGLAEVAMSVGDLEAAHRHLDQVRYFNREFPELNKMYAKLKRVTEIHNLLARANEAMQRRDFKTVENFVQRIRQIDENNLSAKELLAKIEEAKAHKPEKTLSKEDQAALKLRKLKSDLKKAEKQEDLLDMRRILKEILLVSSDTETVKKLEEVQNEIVTSRIHAEERFQQAEMLFSKGEYEKLKLFLNRNPGMMSSMDRMVRIWEMKLMANFYSGQMSAQELTRSAQNILEKSKKNFFASFVLMKLAISDNQLEVAREHYKIAYELNPDFPELRWPGWILWIHGEGRIVVVILLIIALFLMVKLIGPLIAWYESTYFTRVRLLAHVFPSLAIRSLEKCFGTVRGDYERRELFSLLVKCCAKTGNSAKELKYAENLLEINPGNEVAINAIGSHFLKLPELSAEKIELLVKYALINKEDADIVAKTGQAIKKSNRVKPEHLEFLRVYAQRFSDDLEMFSLIGRSLLEIPASEMPDSAISMLEIAWKATESDELWWNFWRVLMFNGKYELAINITEEALRRGKPIVAEKLLEVYDREQLVEANAIVEQINSFDQKQVIKACQELLKIKYVSEEMGAVFFDTLEPLLNEENQDVSFTARQAYDHVKGRVLSTTSACRKLVSVSSDRFIEEELPEKAYRLSLDDSNESESLSQDTVEEVADDSATDNEEDAGHSFAFSEDLATPEDNEDAEDVEDAEFFEELEEHPVSQDNPEEPEEQEDYGYFDPDEDEDEEYDDEVEFEEKTAYDEETEDEEDDEEDDEDDIAPEDYDDYIIGASDLNHIDGAEQEKPTCAASYADIPEYTLEEVDPEDLKDVISGDALPKGPYDSKIKERRSQIFGLLDEIQAPPEISQGWVDCLKKKKIDSKLFSSLDD